MNRPPKVSIRCIESLERRLQLSAIGFRPQVISPPYAEDNTNWVASVDLDGDGDQDLLSAGRSLHFHQNLDGHMESPTALHPHAKDDEWTVVDAGDFDGDGDQDVIASRRKRSADLSSSPQVLLFENMDGRGTMKEGQVIIDGAIRHPIITDLDRDGRLDIVSGGFDGLTWYRNRGDSSFTRIQISRVPGGRFAIGDIDGDQDSDIVAAVGARIVWHENRSQSFRAPQTIHVHTDSDGRICSWCGGSVQIADVDGDGDLDIFSGSRQLGGAGQVAWHENTDGRAEFAAPRGISDSAATSMVSADMDADGDVDLVAVVGSPRDVASRIAWFENTDAQGSFQESPLAAVARVDSPSVVTVDISDSGRPDIVSWSYSSGITRKENLGDGTFADTSPLSGGRLRAISSALGDVNGDDNTDILFAGRHGRIAWFRHLRDPSTLEIQQVTDHAGYVFAITTADVDGDGDYDVISGGFEDFSPHNVFWFENLGRGGFASARLVTEERTRAVAAGDIDGDGDTDIVSSASGSFNLAWFENLDSRGNFGEANGLEGSVDRILSIAIADLDADGDADLIAASRTSIDWYENQNGKGKFGSRIIIASHEGVSLPSSHAVFARDFNRDGKIDLVFANKDRLDWYKNNGQGGFEETRILEQSVDWLNVADMEGDGDIDLVARRGDELIWLVNDLGAGDFRAGPIIKVEVSAIGVGRCRRRWRCRRPSNWDGRQGHSLRGPEYG